MPERSSKPVSKLKRKALSLPLALAVVLVQCLPAAALAQGAAAAAP